MTIKNKLVLILTAADIKYKRFALRTLYSANPDFFPEGDFELHTDIGIIITNVRVRSTYRSGKGYCQGNVGK